MSERMTFTTKDEIEFIDNLKPRITKDGKRIDRLTKLINYRKSILKRENWGEIDKDLSYTHLINSIIKEMNKLQKNRSEIVL